MILSCKSCNLQIKSIFETDSWESIAVAVTKAGLIEGDYFGFGKIDGMHAPRQASVYHARCYELNKKRAYAGPSAFIDLEYLNAGG